MKTYKAGQKKIRKGVDVVRMTIGTTVYGVVTRCGESISMRALNAYAQKGITI